MMFPGLGIPSDRESTVMLPVLLPITTFGSAAWMAARRFLLSSSTSRMVSTT